MSMINLKIPPPSSLMMICVVEETKERRKGAQIYNLNIWEELSGQDKRFIDSLIICVSLEPFS